MCSTLIIGSGAKRLMAANYDYLLDHGLVATNLRGTRKENGRTRSESHISWTVRYGSVTFNSMSLELPTAGINEQGLCVMLLWHDEGDFGSADQLRTLDPLQWIQFQLDNFGSVQEVVDGLSAACPKNQGVPLHYMLLDRSGNCLILEFFDGDPAFVLNPPIPILTNSTYAKSLSAVDDVELGEIELQTSLGRFATLYRQFPSLLQASKQSTAFEVLDQVRQGKSSQQQCYPWDDGRPATSTVWSLVFDPRNRAVHFRTIANRNTRCIHLKRLNFDPSADFLCMDVHAGDEEDATRALHRYDRQDNATIVEASSTAIAMPEEARRQLIDLVDATYRTRTMNIHS